MSSSRHSFSGAAVLTTLSSGINSGVTAIPVNALTGTWPNTATGPFVVTLDRGTASEEKILVSAYTSTQLTATRGYDGTSAVSHNNGATCEHTLDATQIDAHDAVIYAVGAGTPSTSAVGDAAVKGTNVTQPAAGDHKHAREAFGSSQSTTSAVGDSAVDGSNTTLARSDHKHGREAFGNAGNSAPGDVAAAGSATTVSHSDHKHGRETPVAFKAHLVAPSVSLGSGYDKVPIETVDFDTASNWNSSALGYQISAAGYYRVTGSINGSAGNTAQIFQAAIYVNGSLVQAGEQITIRGANGSDAISVAVNTLLHLNVNDLVTLFLYNNGPSNVGVRRQWLHLPSNQPGDLTRTLDVVAHSRTVWERETKEWRGDAQTSPAVANARYGGIDVIHGRRFHASLAASSMLRVNGPIQ